KKISVMSLITVSTQFLRRRFPFPSKRLILIYLTTALSIVSVSNIFLYVFMTYNLEQQSNQELLALAEIAAPILEIVKVEGLQNLEQEVPWRDLFAEQKQSLDWFDSKGKLLAREGKNFQRSYFPQTIAAAKTREDFPFYKRWGQVRTVTIAVYTDNTEGKTETLEGYIRASESTEEINLIRNKLKLALTLRETIAMLLICTISIGFTQQTIMPVKHGLKKLKQLSSEVSHQLRTPLSRISMATEILLAHGDKIQSSETRKLNIINDAVEQLKRVIEDLLVLIRIDLTADPEELQFSDVSLNLLLQNLQARFVPLARSRNIDCQIQMPHNILIKGNTAELNRLLKNLLENAIDYTKPGGKVLVLTKLERKTVTISVQDTGMGITVEELPFIFQHFWRGELAKSKRTEGSGLGLTIAHTIVQQHGGKIEVDSQPGQGSCFKVHLERC
ncbi:sensor histidine kinase, partial [Hyella patelloides]